MGQYNHSVLKGEQRRQKGVRERDVARETGSERCRHAACEGGRSGTRAKGCDQLLVARKVGKWILP